MVLRRSICAGIDTLVEGLCQFLMEGSVGELTVGIYGAWGSGKSTLMKQLMWRIVCHAAAKEFAEQHVRPQDFTFSRSEVSLVALLRITFASLSRRAWRLLLVTELALELPIDTDSLACAVFNFSSAPAEGASV